MFQWNTNIDEIPNDDSLIIVYNPIWYHPYQIKKASARWLIEMMRQKESLKPIAWIYVDIYKPFN